MTKEEIYDREIYPLMKEIIAICQEHKIAVFSSFSLSLEENLVCSTALLNKEYDPPNEFLTAYCYIVGIK